MSTCSGAPAFISKLSKNSKKNISLCIDVMEESMCSLSVCVEGPDKAETIGFCSDTDNDPKIRAGTTYLPVCYNATGDKAESFPAEPVKSRGTFLS